MQIYKVSYTDYIQAESLEQAHDILLEQLSMDVRNDDAEAFEFEGVRITDKTKSPCGRFDLTPEQSEKLYGER